MEPLIFIALFAALIFCANIIGHKLHPPAAKAAKATGAELSASPSLSSRARYGDRPRRGI